MKLPGMSSEIKPKHRREIYEDVAQQSRPSGSYYVMMALSTVIAAYGLMINSAPVVVGAMLVAPLMGPIFGIALALVSANRRLLWQSLQSEIFGILIALFVGALIGLAPLRLPFGSDWLVRTQPTLHDLAIALASGLAGAYAMLDDRVSPALPGVAISVAVLPPLATCGLAAAAANWEMAWGAMQLFIANFFAIQVAAAVVFSLFGMLRVKRDPRARREEEEGLKAMQFMKRFSLSFAVLLIMAAFMTQTLVAYVTDRRLTDTVEAHLTAAVGTISGARLADTSVARENGDLLVTARVFTPRVFEAEEVGAIEDRIAEVVDRDVHLVVRSLISRDIDRRGTVFATSDDARLAEEERERRDFLQRSGEIISRHLRDVPDADLYDLQRSVSDGRVKLTALVNAPEPIGPDVVSTIEESLQSEFGSGLAFAVRTLLARTATSDEFVFEDEAERARHEREALQSTVRTVLDSWLADNVAEGAVDAVDIRSLEPREIVVTVLAPRALTEEEGRAIRNTLIGTIGPEMTLTVRYELGGQIRLPG